jgi:hypothetical protein
MAIMATSWKHLTTGFYDLRRQIAGNAPCLWRYGALGRVVKTKSAAEADSLFFQSNAALKQQFEEIRVRIKATGKPLPSLHDRADDMIAAYFDTLVAIAPETKSRS